jgi:hypothetical protein
MAKQQLSHIKPPAKCLPRVVNGSQTLHSIRDVPNPSPTARAMIRIIQVRPPGVTNFSADAEKRREIIHKISIRSNLQNPIRKWNLIANDNYQHDLARFFRKKKLYYERRAGEWSERRTELKSIGIQRGPNITLLAQLIASYFSKHRHLGPVLAKSKLAELFEDEAYAVIRRTPPELAYQLYLVDSILQACVKELAEHTRYVRELTSYGRFVLFTICTKALKAGGAAFGEPEFSALLETEQEKAPTPGWRAFCKSGVGAIWAAYKKYGKHYRELTGKEPSLANFTKTQEYLGKFIEQPLSRHFQRLGKDLLK